MKYLLCLLLLVGCKSAPWPARIAIGEEHRSEIIESLKDLNNYFKPNLVGSLNELNYSIDVTTFDLEDPVLGLANPQQNSCAIILSERLFHEYEETLKTVVWHEIGHCAGLEHSKKEGDIMYYQASEFSRYTKESIYNFVADVITSLHGKQE